MASRAPIDLEHDPVQLSAADWFTRLQDPALSVDTVTEWQGWMSADARHAAAFREVETLWQAFAAVPCPPGPSVRSLATDAYDGSMSISRWKTRAQAKHTVRMAFAASLVIGFCAALGAWMHSRMSSGEVFQTAVGQNRVVMLQDGSRVELGGHSEMRVSFSEHARDLTLARGEALFDVAKDSARPFVVRAGDARVMAIGTQFNVRRNEDDRVVVSVLEGKVIVQREAAPLALRWLGTSRAEVKETLSAGKRTTIGTSDHERAPVEQMTSADATAWRSGRLAFEGEPLRYVLEDVNRYYPGPIQLGDERIGDLLITGTVRDDNVPAWLASLEPAFGIRVIEEPGRVVLESAP